MTFLGTNMMNIDLQCKFGLGPSRNATYHSSGEVRCTVQYNYVSVEGFLQVCKKALPMLGDEELETTAMLMRTKSGDNKGRLG